MRQWNLKMLKKGDIFLLTDTRKFIEEHFVVKKFPLFEEKDKENQLDIEDI